MGRLRTAVILGGPLGAVAKPLAEAARIGEDGGRGVVGVLVERAPERRERAGADGTAQARVGRTLRGCERDQ